MNTTTASSPALRLVIVGAVAAGASAAARARRLSENAEIILIERGPDVSFANCGLPYHIGGEISDRERLAVQTPESLRALLNVDVRVREEVLCIDRAAREVKIRRLGDGSVYRLGYDRLILAPGAAPLRPKLPGIEDPRIHTLRNLQDMDRIKDALVQARSALVVGAGFIGLEMAEQLRHRGLQVSLVELQTQVLPQLDPEMTAPIAEALRAHGVDLILGDGIDAFSNAEGALTARLKSGRSVQADAVILSIGVRPEAGLAREAGLELTPTGHIRVDAHQQTSDQLIYAAGDAVATLDPILGTTAAVPLGGPANRQGRTAADHIFLGDRAAPYPGSLGTAIVRTFDAVAGVTGWTEKRLRAAQRPYRATTVTDFAHAGYYPGATQVTVKILWDPADGRLLGAQACGFDGIDKRLDVLATALRGRLTVDDLAHLELAYAPPFGSAKDPINVAGFAAQNERLGLMAPVSTFTEEPGLQVVDVRPAEMAAASPLPGAINIPLKALRARLGELDRGRPLLTVCALGKTSYFAARILVQQGFQVRSLSGGLRLVQAARTAGPQEREAKTPSTTTPHPNPSSTIAMTTTAPTRLDCTGLACPGPILKVKDATDSLTPGAVLEITASDAGFQRDLPAFCQATGNEFLGVESKAGLYVGRLRKAIAGSVPTANAPSTTASAATNPNDTTLVVFSQEMDKAMAALVIANGALALGGKTTLFFTFWGLNVLRKDTAPALPEKTFMDRMFGFMMPRGLNRVPLTHMQFGGAGAALMKWRMRSKNLPNLAGLLADAQRQGARIVACSMSMEAMGLRQEELIDGIEIGGVADFLAASGRSGTNLFI